MLTDAFTQVRTVDTKTANHASLNSVLSMISGVCREGTAE